MTRNDDRPALTRALETAAGLKPGTWESVEALSLLATACPDRAEAVRLLDAARGAAAGLRSGTWDGVRALALLARAERDLGRA